MKPFVSISLFRFVWIVSRFVSRSEICRLIGSCLFDHFPQTVARLKHGLLKDLLNVKVANPS